MQQTHCMANSKFAAFWATNMFLLCVCHAASPKQAATSAVSTAWFELWAQLVTSPSSASTAEEIDGCCVWCEARSGLLMGLLIRLAKAGSLDIPRSLEQRGS